MSWFVEDDIPRVRARVQTVAGVVLVIIAVLVIASVRYHGQTLIRGSDAADILLSFFFDASRAIHEEGLWAAMYTPGVQAGVPNWSNPNFHPLYPLYFNWLGSDATVFDTLARMNMIARLHLAILGGGGFYLARRLGARMIPALCVGLVLPWFPAIRSATGWPQIIAGLAWLPWLFALQARLYAATERRDALGAVAGLTLAAILLVYAQPAQNLAFAVFASAFVWIVIGLQALVHRDRKAMRAHAVASGWLALAAVLVALACGGYLVEVLRFHAQSIRWLGEYGGFLIGDQAVPVGAMRLHSIAPSEAWQFLAFEHRKGIGNGYIGAALFIGALLLACVPRDAFARALAACGLLSALFCFAFMAPLLHAIPVANKVREITWWSCLAVVCLLPAAAAGLQVLYARRFDGGQRDDAVRDDRRRPWVNRWTPVFAIALLAALAATFAGPAEYRAEALAALLVGFAALFWMHHARSASQVVPDLIRPDLTRSDLTRSDLTRPDLVGRDLVGRDLAIGVVLLSAAWIPFRHAPAFDVTAAMVFKPDRVLARATAQRLATLLPDEALYRVALDPAIADSNLLVHSYLTGGLRTIRGGISPANHAKFELLYFPNRAVSALYGVKYTVLPASAAQPGDRAVNAGFVVRTDPRALPRLFFARGGLQVADDPVASLRALQDDRAAHLIVARADIPQALDIATFARGAPLITAPTLTKNRRTQLRATLTSDGPGLLVLNEDPGARWRATVDGREIDAFPINGFQTAFAIPAAGHHTIVIDRPGRFATYRF